MVRFNYKRCHVYGAHYIKCHSMAQTKWMIFAGTRINSSALGTPVMPASLLIPLRGKKTAKGKNKPNKSKKEQKLSETREYMKKVEIQKLYQSSALKAAKVAEPLDAEMLNPARKRQITASSSEEQERRYLLKKEWVRYRMKRDIQQQHLLQGMIKSRERALRELKKLAPLLYTKSLGLNSELFPLECMGPSATPPILSYIPPEPEE